MKYKHLALGGTFDLLHKGHEAFLTQAFINTEKVTIGLTSDAMASKKGDPFQSYAARRRQIIDFLNNNSFKNWQIAKIDDALGRAVNDTTMDVILVTEETMSGANAVNKKRGKLNLKPLEIVSFGMIKADDGKKISSGRIKKGEISREGVSFYKLLTKNKKYVLPEYLRESFSKPFGKLYKSVGEFSGARNHLSKLYVVGDYSVSMFIKAGFVPSLSIVDFRIQRKNVYKKLEDLGFKGMPNYDSVDNEPGEITGELITTIYKNLAGRNRIIKVNGEEDLAVLPLVLLAPLRTHVIYGLRDLGLVSIEVTEANKFKFLKILSSFFKNGFKSTLEN